jgi:hypothetical protein
MISDTRILVNRLWAIQINTNPLTDKEIVNKEMYWKREAEKLVFNFLKYQDKLNSKKFKS